MGQLLNTMINVTIYSDGESTDNPRLRDFDYSRQFEGIPTDGSFGRRFSIAPATTLQVATTARSLSQNATTQYSVSLVEGSTYRYQFAAGTNPVLRTVRSIAPDGTSQFTVTRTGNLVRYTSSGGTLVDFVAAGTVVGDQWLVEDDTPFNVLNQGIFTIVNVAATYVEIVNEVGVAEGPITIGTLGSGLPVVGVFSAAGVQVRDEVRITSTALNIENRGIFTVTRITNNYFDVANGNPGVPSSAVALGAADGIVFYPSIYKWIYVESDQKISVRINGDTSDRVEIEPLVAADPLQVGVFLQRGGVYTLTLANNGLTTANVKAVLSE